MQVTRLIKPLLVAGMLFAFPAAGNLYIYPAKGQSAEQQKKDESACSSWAAQQTGYDPANPPKVATPPPPMPTGGLVRGGLRGAAIGAAGGAIGGDAGEGAAIGATTGAMLGGIRRRDQMRQVEYQQQQQEATIQQEKANWQKAYTTCLKGRGYTVS